MEYVNQEHGITVKVKADPTLKGPFRADIRCLVTGRYLGGVECAQTKEAAFSGGKKLARRFYH